MTIIPFSTLKADQLHPRQHMPIDYRQVNVKEVMLASIGNFNHANEQTHGWTLHTYPESGNFIRISTGKSEWAENQNGQENQNGRNFYWKKRNWEEFTRSWIILGRYQVAQVHCLPASNSLKLCGR